MQRIFLLLIILLLSIPTMAQTRPFAEGEVDNSNPYVGQPVVYTLRIFSQDTINSNSTIIEANFFGFGRSSIILDPLSYTDTIEGITYNVIEKSYVIYPLRAGELTIEPFQIDIPETPFAPANTLFVDAVTIRVQDYPEPKPENFGNAVGQFDILAEASPSNLNSGDALAMNLTVSGTGNLEQMLAPELDLPETWRILETNSEFQQDNLRFGNRIFSWTVIVEGDGLVDFPAIEFSYFNPQTRRYESRQTAPIALDIAPSAQQTEVTIEVSPIAVETVFVPELLQVRSGLLPFTLPTWFWILWIFPPLFSFFVWLLTRPKSENVKKQAKTRKRSGSRALKDLKKTLEQAQSLEPKTAYQEIAGSIYTYLGSKTGEIVSNNNVSEVLIDYPGNYRKALLSCLEEANSGQYAPIGEEDVNRLVQRVLRVCTAIEEVKK